MDKNTQEKPLLLSTRDKKILLNAGYHDYDFFTIEQKMNDTLLYIGENEISRKKAIHEIGRKKYILGCARAAFDYYAEQENDQTGKKVIFKYLEDNRALLKAILNAAENLGYDYDFIKRMFYNALKLMLPLQEVMQLFVDTYGVESVFFALEMDKKMAIRNDIAGFRNEYERLTNEITR